MPNVHTPGKAHADTAVIEVNGSQTLPEFLGQPAEEDSNIVRRKVMNASGTRRAARESNSPYSCNRSQIFLELVLRPGGVRVMKEAWPNSSRKTKYAN